MTSNANWSDRTDSSEPPPTNTTGLGASPSQTKIGDEHIAEFSDVFREAINARNIYAAWARKIPATEKELNKIVFRVKNKAVEPLPPKNQEAKKPAVVPPPLPSTSPRKGRKAAKRSVDADGLAPPSSLLGKLALPFVPSTLPNPSFRDFCRRRAFGR
ncbi:hypothetical protein TNCV_2589641 [Trichonephila clavipes]|nr:hypothetical protein TNCV_2589641 [Trichonephila clavipes]